MTRAQLNTLIDTNVTNKSAPNSLSPANEGGAMKSVADYVDQEITNLDGSVNSTISELQAQVDAIPLNLFTTKITITQAQILDLFTTPIVILSSTTAGHAKIPLNILCRRSGSGTNYTIANNQFALKSSSGATFTMSLFNSILTSTQLVSYVNLSYNGATQIASGIDNETYSLGCYTSNPTGGTGNMDVWVTYLDIAL